MSYRVETETKSYQVSWIHLFLLPPLLRRYNDRKRCSIMTVCKAVDGNTQENICNTSDKLTCVGVAFLLLLYSTCTPAPYQPGLPANQLFSSYLVTPPCSIHPRFEWNPNYYHWEHKSDNCQFMPIWLELKKKKKSDANVFLFNHL